MTQMSIKHIKQIIAEEVQQLLEKKSDKEEDHSQMARVVKAASDLLSALSTFDKVASGPMVNALGSHVEEMRKLLRNMVETPASYVQKSKGQKITFKSSGSSSEE